MRSLRPSSLTLGLCGLFAATAITEGAGLVLNEIGGTMGAGNLALAGTPFAKDLLGGGAFAPTHTIPNVNNGSYGNPSSWIGDSLNSFVGVSFGASPVAIGRVAWGRDNTHTFFDRTAGLYTLQYTTVPNPNASTPDGNWTTLGTVNYEFQGADSMVTLTQRHLWSFGSVNATGIRLITPGNGIGSGTAIDELEAFGYAAPALTQTAIGGSLTLATDVAASANGGVAFAKDVIGGGTFAPTHTIPNVNDGIYGNPNSWIGDSEGSFVGVKFASAQTIDRIAFGRDNTGTFGDRATGSYLVQYTTTANPSASTPDSSWTTIGPAYFDLSDPTPSLRHEFSFAPVAGATGLRLVAQGNGLANGRAIDELEVYAIPEPAATGLLAGAILLLGLRRRRD